jgi:hypothetical protein
MACKVTKRVCRGEKSLTTDYTDGYGVRIQPVGITEYTEHTEMKNWSHRVIRWFLNYVCSMYSVVKNRVLKFDLIRAN